jgi:hypothetical protein
MTVAYTITLAGRQLLDRLGDDLPTPLQVKDPALQDSPVQKNPFMTAEMKMVALFTVLVIIPHLGRLAPGHRRRHLALHVAELRRLALEHGEK